MGTEAGPRRADGCGPSNKLTTLVTGERGVIASLGVLLL
jgi:hypothetical protein